MTATISLEDLYDVMENFYGRRVDIGRSERSRATLDAIDADLVAWFAERDVTLVVDRDTVTYERLQASEARTKSEFAEYDDAQLGTMVIIHRNWGRSDEEIAEILGADIADLQRWVVVSLAASAAAVHDELYGGELTKFDMIAEIAAERGIPIIDIAAGTRPEDRSTRMDSAVVERRIEQPGGINHTGIVRSVDYTDYTLEVTLGDDIHSFIMSQRYASEDMAKRDYLAAAIPGVVRVAVVRHTQDASQIIHSWEPS